MVILNKLILYSWLTNSAVLKDIYLWIFKLPNLSLTCVHKYLWPILQSLPYKINFLCNLRHSFFEWKLNWAVLNKVGLLSCANWESSAQSAVLSNPDSSKQVPYIVDMTLITLSGYEGISENMLFANAQRSFVMVLLSLSYIIKLDRTVL